MTDQEPLRRKVYKVTVAVTVLTRDPSGFEDMSLEDIAYHIGEGSDIGAYTVAEPVALADHEVRRELELVGNDGEFFGDEDGDDEDWGDEDWDDEDHGNG